MICGLMAQHRQAADTVEVFCTGDFNVPQVHTTPSRKYPPICIYGASYSEGVIFTASHSPRPSGS
jgi:hypothetical protein